MFASGLGPISVAVFSITTMLIAIPTGVKIFNWTLTMWGGKLKFPTAMLFAIGLVVQFTIGGLSGVTHAVAPSDTQQTDTYYIVAHFHYVIFGGAVLGLFAGIYYWWPKIFGKCSTSGGALELLAHDHRDEPHVRPDAHHRSQGQPRRMYVWTEARRVRVLQPRLLEPGRHRRLVHPRLRGAAVPRQRRRSAARRRRRLPTRGTPAASSG